jgi:hypothetical protein
MKKGWNGMTGDLSVKSVLKGAETANKIHWSGKYKILGPNKASYKFLTGVNGHNINLDLDNIDFANIDPADKAKFLTFLEKLKKNIKTNMNRVKPDPELTKWTMNALNLLRQNGTMGPGTSMIPGSPKQPIFQKKRAATQFRRRAPRRANTRGKRWR